MNEVVDGLKGDAASGSLVDLSTAMNAVDDALNEHSMDHETGVAAHSMLEDLQSFLVDGGSYAGAGDQVSAFTSGLNAFL